MAEALEPAVVYMLPYDVLQKLLEQSKEINAFYRRYWNTHSSYRK